MYCCEKLRTAIETASFEKDPADNLWNVNGCCGGGCFIVIEIAFCPWCGTALPEKVAENVMEVNTGGKHDSVRASRTR